MKRLNEIRSYLRNRLANCKGTMTIFHDPWRGCFAERYYDESSDSSSLKALHRRIEMGTEIKREEKKQEIRSKNMRYENLLRQHSTSACEIRYNENGISLHDDRHCQKCISEKEMNRMKITLHEDPLPSDSIKAKCVVFELGCPEAFLQYRDATWTLIGVFGGTDPLASDAKITLLSDYSRSKITWIRSKSNNSKHEARSTRLVLLRRRNLIYELTTQRDPPTTVSFQLTKMIYHDHTAWITPSSTTSSKFGLHVFSLHRPLPVTVS